MLTLSVEDFPASLSASLGGDRNRPMPDGSGPKWHPSSTESDRDGSCGRTCPVCFPVDWTSSTETLFDWDTGTAWGGPPLVRWVRHTCGVDCSVWPTPVAKDGARGGLSPEAKARRESNAKTGLSLPEVLGGPSNPEFVEWLMGFPAGWTDVEPSETP